MNTERTKQRRYFQHTRRLLAGVFILHRLGDAAVLYAAFLPRAPHPALRGVARGALIWTAVLLVAVWRRLRWARYLLTTFGWLYALALCFVVLGRWSELSLKPLDLGAWPLAGAACYLIANLILVRSARLRHYANH